MFIFDEVMVFNVNRKYKFPKITIDFLIFWFK